LEGRGTAEELLEVSLRARDFVPVPPEILRTMLYVVKCNL
jgi:hypothetical protein